MGGGWFDPWARPIFFPRTDESHCNRIHSPLTAVLSFDNGYVGKQLVAWEEYCWEYWLKELKGSTDRCTDSPDITEILLETALKTIQSNKLSIPCSEKGLYSVCLNCQPKSTSTVHASYHWSIYFAISKPMGECNTILNAYTLYMHLG